ncbi:head-tail connector protein [Mameliella sediminis]|uniref:head-tail connector protein n=1 Tax=Mameliella sediminis TaxID=2836866 RepID=UPI001C449182|nr:hypothetical protein [Mameliella sediminis]MBV7394559.1 hypothetical protein [Mameliella sediminis]
MLEQLTPPAAEVLTSADVTLRAQLRLEPGETDEDGLIDAQAAAARVYVEGYTRRALLPQSWRLTLAGFPACEIALPLAPVIEIEAVRYTQADGSLAALDPGAFRLMRIAGRHHAAPAFGAAWPASAQGGEVQIDFRAGYTDAAAIPAPILQAMRLTAAHYFRHREGVEKGDLAALPLGAADLLAPFRVFS